MVQIFTNGEHLIWIDTGIGLIEKKRIDARGDEHGAVTGEDEGVLDVVVAEFRLSPKVEGTGFPPFWSEWVLGENLGDVLDRNVFYVMRIPADPEKIEQSDLAVRTRWTDLGIRGQLAADSVGGHPGIGEDVSICRDLCK